MPTRSSLTRRHRELPPSHQLQRDNYLEWRAYLPRWPWEWWITLPIKEGINYFRAHEILKKWRLQLTHEEGLQLGYYMISSSKMKVLHFHLLALGRNSEGKTLLDCTADTWETRWPFKIKAKIAEVYDRAGIAKYFAKHLWGYVSDHAEIDSFNRKLLEETMEVRNDGLDGLDGLDYRRNGFGSHVC